AKMAILIGHQVPCSIWTPAAYLWQDALAALVLGGIGLLMRGHARVMWPIYGAAVLYVSVNVPLTRILSSPLTWQMGRAARGALADSIRYYLTLPNLALIAVFILAGWLLPLLLRRVSGRATMITAFAAVLLAAVGPIATRQIE